MPLSFKEMTINAFIEELSSKSPAPGGGTAAALGGATGISLLEMVANLTIGKKGFESVQEEMGKKVEIFKEAKTNLLNLMDTDTEVFNAFMSALKLPKETEEQKKTRKERIQGALKKAAEVPLMVAKQILSAMKEAYFMAENGNPNALSDVGVGILFAEAAVKSAIYNVFINLSSIKDETFVKEYREESESVLKQASDIASSVIPKIEKKLKE